MNNHTNYFSTPFISKENSHKANKTFFPVATAFANGAIEKDIYQGYKHYLPRPLVLNNTIEGIKRTMQAYYFAINDLVLYLDIHPDDVEALNLFNEYVNKLNNIADEYTKMNGPINFYSKEENPYIWNQTWPWERSSY